MSLQLGIAFYMELQMNINNIDNGSDSM